MPGLKSISAQPQITPASVTTEPLPLEQQCYKKSLLPIPIQQKSAIGAINDSLKDGAGAMADKVMRKAEVTTVPPFIQTQSVVNCKASDAISSRINATKGAGSAMDKPVQSFMESRFGNDFSEVKIHTGDYAVQMSRELGAQAFTVGKDIYFNAGKYVPDTDNGRHLLAHELTHAMQQRTTIRRKPEDKFGRPLGFFPTPEQETYDKASVEIDEHLFEIMRNGFPGTKGNAYLRTVIEKKFKPGTDDYWLAMNLLDNGPETLWPANLLTELYAKATKNGWGPVEGTIGTTAAKRPVTSFYFPGKTDNRALIIAGVHGSELSGIEVVNILINRLKQGPKPYYTVIIIPSLFPDNAATAESKPKQIETGENVGRYTVGTEAKHSKDPNRQFPAFGKGLDAASKKDAKGDPIEEENLILLQLIDRFRPARIASVHSTHGPKDGGIYADPRTNAAGKALGYDSDKKLALEMADAAKAGGAQLPGNKFGADGKATNSVYPLDPAIAGPGKQQKRETAKGDSLGGWGSTAVCDAANPSANRPAMRVITVEVQTARRSTDVDPDKAAARAKELEALATVLQDIFIGPGQTDEKGDPCAS